MSKLSDHAKALKALDGKNIDVGWFENARYATGQSVAAVMIANEFGTKTAVARPLIRQSAEQIDQKLPGYIARRTTEILDGRLSADNYLEKMGEALVATVLATLKSGNFEDNKESTIKQKGFNRPLVDTGILGQSVTHRVSK